MFMDKKQDPEKKWQNLAVSWVAFLVAAALVSVHASSGNEEDGLPVFLFLITQGIGLVLSVPLLFLRLLGKSYRKFPVMYYFTGLLHLILSFAGSSLLFFRSNLRIEPLLMLTEINLALAFLILRDIKTNQKG